MWRNTSVIWTKFWPGVNVKGYQLNSLSAYLYRTEIPVLGDFVGRAGTRIDPDKVKAMSEWPVPATKQQLKSFLGTVSWNMKFCKDYTRRQKGRQRMKRFN